jgi:hypothetical protein
MPDNNQPDNIDSDTIVSAIQFWKKVYDEKDVIISFVKQDGTTRVMRCTLDFTKIPKRDKPKSVDIQKILKLIQKNKIMHVYDLEKMGWRSVPFDRVNYMDTRDRRFFTRPPKERGNLSGRTVRTPK